jgi:hypothetical protein
MPIAQRSGSAFWQNGILVYEDWDFDIYQTTPPLSDVRSQGSKHQYYLADKQGTHGNLACGLVISAGTN